MNFETDQSIGTVFKVSVNMLMPVMNTPLQKGCTSYFMPEISKNEIAILKSNRGSLTR